ncbi:hypothetical protein HDU87_002884 [Geranomyces variabilis]|uniref:Rhodanese domain-containing protein n=1 Tax=Geranomyces variabilis TaxID=109894 RepID=A0AAD5TKZ3_9FUNG|nr:hypothetical protein HDU87_002884 [Geranomyces variabilis]
MQFASRTIASAVRCSARLPAARSFSQTSAARGIFAEHINSTRGTTKEMSPADLNAKLVENPAGGTGGLHLLDVREPYEWNEEKIPQATYTGRGMLEATLETRFPNVNDQYVLYCASGARSALAANALTEMGYKNVYSLRGGISGWKNEGFVTTQNFRNVGGFR